MKRRIIIGLGLFLLRILASTWRIHVRGEHPSSQRGIIIVWHGHMLCVWKYFAHRSMAGLTSHSKDGDVLATLLSTWNYTVLRGSSSKGGAEVLEQIISTAKEQTVIITPDGPRGPAYVPKAGAFVAAQRSETMLYPCRVHLQKAYFLQSWDSFAIPFPFSQCTVEFLEPIHIAKEADRETITALMEETAKKMNSNM